MVGLKIKEYLDAKGIKYSYLAEKTGMPMNILSPTLNGKRKLSAEEYFIICEALGVSAEIFSPDGEERGDQMEQMKKEIESLKKKTFYLQLLITVTLINVIFFSITQTRQYCSVMSYYRQTIELNQDLNQILQDTNQLEEEILSKIRQILIAKTVKNLKIEKDYSIVCKVRFFHE